MSVQEEIETILSSAEPTVEVLRVDPIGKDTLRIYIDAPEGVSLDLCTRVTHAIAPIRERYAVEVSSPGSKRPLTRPAHFVRFVGRVAKVTLTAPQNDGSPGGARSSPPMTAPSRSAPTRACSRSSTPTSSKPT